MTVMYMYMQVFEHTYTEVSQDFTPQKTVKNAQCQILDSQGRLYRIAEANKPIKLTVPV